MNMVRGFGDHLDDDDDLWQEDAEVSVERPPSIGDDERRMQVRAYNYWVSLLKGRDFPAVEDIEPGTIGEFGQNSVLLDFSAGIEHPAIIFLGNALRAECGVEAEVTQITDVPARSLLSRLTDHYLQIIANRVPVGFEAEFTNQRGSEIMYRGILMPFSSSGDRIDFIYGVINWKEQVDAATEAELAVEIHQALRSVPRPAMPVPVWEDGPNARPVHDRVSAPIPVGYGLDDDEDGAEDDEDHIPEVRDDDGLAERLAAARAGADIVKSADGRSRAALYRALGLAYDFALLAEARPEDFAELVEDAGLIVQARAPMTPVVKLVFGVGYDKTRLTEFAAALTQGRRHAVPLGGLRHFLETHAGGLKGVVQAARAERRAPDKARTDRDAAARAVLQAMPARGIVDIAAGDEEFVLLVARRTVEGSLAVLAPVTGDDVLLARAMRRVSR